MELVKGFPEHMGHASYMECDKNGYLYMLTTKNELFAIKGTQVVKQTVAPEMQPFNRDQQLRARLKHNDNGQVIYTCKDIFLLNAAEQNANY